jgi:hypothetical protein
MSIKCSNQPRKALLFEAELIPLLFELVLKSCAKIQKFLYQGKFFIFVA